jgi:uncharacterized membrane protein YbaN (DUF454 family)
LRAKVLALGLMWASIALAIAYVRYPWARIAMGVVAAGVTVYLLKLPTLRPGRTEGAIGAQAAE